MLTTVLGLNFGDEGKGKLVDILAGKHHFVARFGGGANAGHTIVVNGEKHVLHQLPSGVLHPQTKNVIGNGCVIHLPGLIEEMTEIQRSGVSFSDRLFISNRATILFDYHKELDGLAEKRRGAKAVGTTKRGIGPAYTDKIARESFRMADLLADDFAERLRAKLEALNSLAELDVKFDVEKEIALYSDIRERLAGTIIDTADLLQSALRENKHVLAEGAQGSMLDVDHGTYPFVTSSTTTIGGVFAGLGIAPVKEMETIGVVKAYTTRVGAGPFPTELENELGEKLREVGHEFGATTGRPRRCGWLDLFSTRFTARLNGVTAINLTKLDVLNDFKEIQVCIGYKLDGEKIETHPATIPELACVEPIYETFPGWCADTSGVKKIKDLPANARKYIKFIEAYLETPIRWVGVGVEREAMAE